MARVTPLTEDRITGQVAPLGYITGFPQPHYKSPWPSAPTKPLTDRRIAKHQKAGRYITNMETSRQEVKKRVRTFTKVTKRMEIGV